MTFNEAAWCAEIAADPSGKFTEALSMKGLTTLLSTPDDYWSSLMSRLHQYLDNKTFPFECKWYIEDMQRLRGEFQRDGKRKCLDERPGDLLKIYFKWFYGMVGRLNKEGAFAPPPYGEGPPYYATTTPSKMVSGVGSSSSSSSRSSSTMSSSARSYPPAYATNAPSKMTSGLGSTSSSDRSYPPPAYATNAPSKMMSGAGSASSSASRSQVSTIPSSSRSDPAKTKLNRDSRSSVPSKIASGLGSKAIQSTISEPSTISSSSSRSGSNIPAKTELNRAFGDSTKTIIPAMVTDKELDEMEAEIKRKMKMKKGGSSSVSQVKSVLNRGAGDSTRTFLPAMVSEEEMEEMLKDIEKKRKERKRQGLKTVR